MSLKIERIGSDRLGHQPAWVKRVTGLRPRGLVEEYVDGQADYTHANSVGSRGIYYYYLLQEGDIYHVSSPRNFKSRDTYFCQVINGQVATMEFDEVIQTLQRRRPERRLVDVDTGERIDV